MSDGLRLSVLGTFQCEQAGQLVQLVSAKGRALLAYLALQQRAFSRAALASLLWSNLPDADARRNLRVEVMKLRQAVGDYLLVDGQTLALNRALPCWLDVEQFEAGGIGELETAVSLYRGDLLEDLFVRQAPLFETWLEQERSRLHEKMLNFRLELAQRQARQQQYDDATHHLQFILTATPTREAAHRQLIQILAAQGKRSAALAQFETCRTLLAEQLGIEPAAETMALLEEIRQGRRSKGAKEQRSKGAKTPPRLASISPSTFIAGPPILNPQHFFGRERIVRRLFGLLRQRPLQNAAIIGPRRSGKTSLLHYIRQITTAVSTRPNQRTDWLAQPEQYRWIFVDFQDSRLGTEQGLLRHLLTQMEIAVPKPCNLDNFLDLVSEQLAQPTIILLDEIGVALGRYPELDDAFWESLRSLATNQVNGNLAFILTAQERPETLASSQGMGSPFFNIFGYTATLGPLDEKAAHELMGNAPTPFTAEDTTWMLQKSGRWPILLQILCRERLLALEEDVDNWQEEAWAQAAPFAKTLFTFM